MTTRPPARAGQCDIPALHAVIASAPALQQERRTLYQLAADLLEHDAAQVLDLDILDSPLARNRIGDALAGRAALSGPDLVGLSALGPAGDAEHELRVASRPAAAALLAGALENIGAELGGQHGAGTSPLRVLTETDGDRFTSARTVLRDGVAFALSVSPELVDDLLGHIALAAILDPPSARGLASASSRSFPGLILLESPRSRIEVAEAIVHEGAHQKLFDLAITHDLLNGVSDGCVPFHPPWGPAEQLWSLERTLAAGHAYACMARFAQDAGVASGAQAVGADSLLPLAGERSEIIGQWLLDKGDHLGPDAHTLLAGLLGRQPRTTFAAAAPRRDPATDYAIDAGLELRRCSSNRVLVGLPSRPPQLYWVSEDAAAVLEILGRKPLGELVDTLAQRWQVSHSDANDQLTTLLSDLCESGLVTPRSTTGTGP
jgi:hypothetical protein